MRIYNGTNSVMSLPLMGKERITISPKTPSGHILCSSGIISLLITSYTTDEIALIVSGPFEISTCANIPVAVNYVVQSLEEAIKRFSKQEPEKEPETTINEDSEPKSTDKEEEDIKNEEETPEEVELSLDDKEKPEVSETEEEPKKSKSRKKGKKTEK